MLIITRPKERENTFTRTTQRKSGHTYIVPPKLVQPKLIEIFKSFRLIAWKPRLNFTWSQFVRKSKVQNSQALPINLQPSDSFQLQRDTSIGVPASLAARHSTSRRHRSNPPTRYHSLSNCACLYEI